MTTRILTTALPLPGDRVAITSTDGFDGKQGVLDRIASNDAYWYEYAYWVNFGLRWYGRKIVPFRRDEIAKVEAR